ncbi:aldehyde dehydrogenase family protein [Pelagibius sp.]|uniref:aldehyde dehydrogenase family protein n=1 Tax=Pelagibius sp. TaxID=1931238 RepID=UPI002AC31F7D|nr:aldehyde dehydrogenase family protein [Pelagibius sp.]
MQNNLIAGAWVEGSDSVDNINPSDLDDVIDSYARADAAQVNEAVAAAKAAFPAWSTGPIQARATMLAAVATEIMARKEELGELLSREEGKTRPEGIGEVMRAAQIFDFFAGEVVRQSGEKIASVRPGIDVDITREPLGVIGLITPWNFPIAIPAWKIAPALAFANCVVIKPAEIAPASAHALAGIIQRAGVPEGVFNLVMGKGSVVGEALVNHPDVAAISFTGSVETGKRIAANCAQRLAKVQLEMGGKNPLVVLDDADLGTAVDCALNGAFFSTGQRCTASSRLVVQKGIHNAFVDALVERMQALKVDNALTEGTQMGPVVDQSQLDQDLKYLDVGRDEGAKLAWGGERLNRATQGFYLQPALFTETDNAMRINREEIFGPIASVIAVDDYEQALEVANDTAFGLSSGICTGSLKHASHFKRHSQAGMVMVNLPTAGVDYHVPFGGRKGSSYGSREQGRYAAEFYTTVKTGYTLPV